MEQIKELWDPEFAVNTKTTFIIRRFCHPPAVDVQTANTLSDLSDKAVTGPDFGHYKIIFEKR